MSILHAMGSLMKSRFGFCDPKKLKTKSMNEEKREATAKVRQAGSLRGGA